MHINKLNNTQTFGMPLAKGFYKQWNKPKGVFGVSSEVILHKLDSTTPEHFITRTNNFTDAFWVAAPKIGSSARKIKVGESFLYPTEYYSLEKFAEEFSKEYKRLAKLHKKH